MNRFATSATKADVENRRDSLTEKRALTMKAAREYIIAHPGCDEKAIAAATGCGIVGLSRLLNLGAIRREGSWQSGGVRWWPSDMQSKEEA